MNFIKKIFENEVDEQTHNQFVRFGKGEYRNRFLLNLWKTKKTKVKSSFEFANDFVSFCSRLGECEISGIILSKEDISGLLSETKIKAISETKKGGLYYQNNISKQRVNKESILDIVEKSYFSLLDIEGDGFKLKMKKKLPKPGKDENKIDDKFCQLELEERFYNQLIEDFFWDVRGGKKIKVKHSISIKEIIFPQGEKDFSKIREIAKRKGELIREIDVDGNILKKEINFEA